MDILTYSLADAANMIGGTDVSAASIRRQLAAGRVSGCKLGREWRMTRADIDAYVAAHHRAATVVANPTGQTQQSRRRAKA